MWNVLRDVLVRLRSLEQDVLALEMYPTVAQQLRYLADLIEYDAGRRTYAHYLATTTEGGESNGQEADAHAHQEGRQDAEQEEQQGLLTDAPGCGTCGGPWVPVAGGGRTVAHVVGCLWWGNGW